MSDEPKGAWLKFGPFPEFGPTGSVGPQDSPGVHSQVKPVAGFHYLGEPEPLQYVGTYHFPHHYPAAHAYGRVRAAITEAGSQRAFAAQIGISEQFLSDQLNGRRDLCDRVLYAVGLRRKVMYVEAGKDHPRRDVVDRND